MTAWPGSAFFRIGVEKSWWSRNAMTGSDWGELVDGIALLVSDIRTWEQRRDRLREAVAGAKTLKGEGSRVTKTLVDSGWDATVSIHNPRPVAWGSGQRSRVVMDFDHRPGKQRVSTLGKDIERMGTYLRATPEPIGLTELRLDRRTARSLPKPRGLG